jgi:long-chain acyl-CoA synthetase
VIDLSGQASLASALAAAVERWPHQICLIELDRDRENHRLTYREFSDRASAFAGFLQASGFQPGSRAAIILTNQSAWLIAAYAVFMAGGVLVPLDPKLTAEEHRDLIAHSGSDFLIIEHHILRSLAALKEPRYTNETVTVVVGASATDDIGPARRWDDSMGPAAPIHPRARNDLACIVYSSGTGGQPKGCMLSHGNYLEQCAALAEVHRMAEGERYLSILPTNHAIDFMAGFIGPFVCGATVIHLRTLRPEHVRTALTKYGITHVTLVPMILKNLETAIRARLEARSGGTRRITNALIGINKALTRRRLNPALSRRLLGPIHAAVGPSLRAVFVGGAFTDPATLQFFRDLGFPVANGYGLTEACTVLTLNDVSNPTTDSVGKPLPGVEVKIVDPGQDGIGQVAVRGNTVMLGYLDDPALTADTIRDGWLLTGDLGRLDDHGHLHLVGRVKNMIVTAGGKNVYPEDVEAAFDGLPVEEFCVFAASYLWRATSLADDKLVAVLRLSNGAATDSRTIDAFRQRNRQLPDYKRLGGYVRWDEAFPRTPSLKVKRDALAERLRGRLDAGGVADL